jgi:amino acid adenylation domain-containing protein
MQIEDSYPLSPVQHAMLVHSLAAPRSGVYVQQLVSTVREEINVPAFRKAWECIVSRHAAFRTRFNWKIPGEPVQQVYPDVQLPFIFQDWKDLPADRQQRLLETFLQLDRIHGFNLERPPLLRLAVFRFSEGDYRWVWTSHHAVLDGRSRLLVLKELSAMYTGFSSGGTVHLASPRPYREYIDWLSRQDLTAAEKFWRSVLSGFTAPTPLAIDRASPQTQAEEVGEQRVRLSESFTKNLLNLAERSRLTANTFLQGAWALLLARYSGEENVVFGATRAGRHSTLGGANSMVGVFINTLPVRVHVTPGRGLLDWLKEIRSRWIAMRDFEHTPLVQILKWSDVSAGSPLFESLLTFENYDLECALKNDGCLDQEFRLFGATNYPLSIAGYLGKDLVLNVIYDRRRFEDSAMTRMLGHLTTLLEAMVSAPASRLSDLPLLTERERYQLTAEWNDTSRDYPKHQCFAELFEAQVERSPGAIAAVFGKYQLTYRELNRRANQLAHHLQELGVGPEVTVGICMERCPEMLVALLGVLKAGGAYVPLDPMLPEERLSFTIGDSRVGMLLTEESSGLDSDPAGVRPNSMPPFGQIRSRFPGCRVIDLVDDWEVISRESEHNPSAAAQPQSLAYILYTSGTTGRPKGVMLDQRSLVNYLHWVNRDLMGKKVASLPAITKLSFDASLKQLLAPLLRGRAVWLVPTALSTDPSKLLNAIAGRSAIAINCVPSLWKSLLEELKFGKSAASADNLACVFVGGERISTELVRNTFAALPDLEIWNLYGPTEATANATAARITKEDEVTLGRPIANTQVYILDPQLRPVPVGVAGQLHIGGAGLARGYLNHPEMTAEKFIPNPFSGEPGARLYKTGDLARYRADGNIEFLGRLDNQVKIRGFRIELEEVEAILRQHPAVADAAVLARDNRPDDKRLVGYIVPCGTAAPAASELRSFLKTKLPEHAVPVSFVTLGALPLTSLGKLDRRALSRVAEDIPSETGDGCAPPASPIERELARIWSEVLGRNGIGRDDNFFTLGGHSLLATQVVSRVYKTFQVELPVGTLFETATLSGLAAAIEAAAKHRGKPPSSAIRPRPRQLQRLDFS